MSPPDLSTEREPEKRQADRYRVCLPVRYGNAGEFMHEYAENLSQGGLFVPGAHHLRVGGKLNVEIELPGLGAFYVRCRVAHVLSPDEADWNARKPGAGLALVEPHHEFDRALTTYLGRLHRRAGAVVLVRGTVCQTALAKTGYRVVVAPPSSELGEALATIDAPVVGIVVQRSLLGWYEKCPAVQGGLLVMGMERAEEVGAILTLLDLEL
jgi:Tfp pilus assembly protein PilZ